MQADYAEIEPQRAEIDRLAGATVLEFGTPIAVKTRNPPHRRP